VRKTEYQHNTPEQVREYVEAALALVEELDPPADLREACFTQALNMTSAKQIFYEQAAMGALDLNRIAR